MKMVLNSQQEKELEAAKKVVESIPTDLPSPETPQIVKGMPELPPLEAEVFDELEKPKPLKKSVWKKLKDKYIYIVGKCKYYYLLDTTKHIKLLIKKFILGLIEVTISSIMIMMTLRFIGIGVTWINYLSSIALYFVIQELPSYFKKFKGRK